MSKSPHVRAFDRNWNCLYDNATDSRTLDEFMQGAPATRAERLIYHVTVDEHVERVSGQLVNWQGDVLRRDLQARRGCDGVKDVKA